VIGYWTGARRGPPASTAGFLVASAGGREPSPRCYTPSFPPCAPWMNVRRPKRGNLGWSGARSSDGCSRLSRSHWTRCGVWARGPVACGAAIPCPFGGVRPLVRRPSSSSRSASAFTAVLRRGAARAPDRRGAWPESIGRRGVTRRCRGNPVWLLARSRYSCFSAGLVRIYQAGLPRRHRHGRGSAPRAGCALVTTSSRSRRLPSCRFCRRRISVTASALEARAGDPLRRHDARGAVGHQRPHIVDYLRREYRRIAWLPGTVGDAAMRLRATTTMTDRISPS
jgi:hypothetical protein